MKKTIFIIFISFLFIQCNKKIAFEDLKGKWKVTEVNCNENDVFCKSGDFQNAVFEFIDKDHYERYDGNSNSGKQKKLELNDRIIKLQGEPTHDIIIQSIDGNVMRWSLMYRGLSSNLKLEKTE